MGYFSVVMNFSTIPVEVSGFPPLSWMSRTSFAPLTPPLALISAAAISYACFSISPNFASAPVRGSGMPTLKVFSWARAGKARARRRARVRARFDLFIRVSPSFAAGCRRTWFLPGASNRARPQTASFETFSGLVRHTRVPRVLRVRGGPEGSEEAPDRDELRSPDRASRRGAPRRGAAASDRGGRAGGPRRLRGPRGGRAGAAEPHLRRAGAEAEGAALPRALSRAGPVTQDRLLGRVHLRRRRGDGHGPSRARARRAAGRRAPPLPKG